MSETTDETSTEPDPFDAAPEEYAPPMMERRLLADEAMKILLQGRQRLPFGSAAISAEQVILLAEYIRSGQPLGPEPDFSPVWQDASPPARPEFTLVDVKTVRPGTRFLNVANEEGEIVAPPRIGPTSTIIKYRDPEGYVHHPNYDNATMLRVTHTPEPEPVTYPASALIPGDVFLENDERRIIQSVNDYGPGAVTVSWTVSGGDKRHTISRRFSRDAKMRVVFKRERNTETIDPV